MAVSARMEGRLNTPTPCHLGIHAPVSLERSGKCTGAGLERYDGSDTAPAAPGRHPGSRGLTTRPCSSEW